MPAPRVQVSELSHKLGSAEGSNRSLQEENARLKAAHQLASAGKHEADIQLNEARAKVLALEEKVRGGGGGGGRGGGGGHGLLLAGWRQWWW